MIDMALLKGRESELAANLSGGWKQRLALGCAIISRPSILFLVEPTSGVSPTSRRAFFKIIQRLANENTTVMVTTHFIDEAERCYRIAFISEGNLIADDTPENQKNKVIKGALAEVVHPNALYIIDDIEKLPYVKECSNHGPALHVLLESGSALQALEQYTGVKAKIIKPSLEDVFVSLARQNRRQVS